MTYSQANVTTPDFRVLFESAPNLYIVLTPDLTIAAASDAYLRATQTKREEIIGRYVFDVFPDNPEEISATGVYNWRNSLELVLKHRVAHTMAVQKYDVRRPESAGGGFEEKYWSPINSPVFGANGEITHIIHRTEDVTEFVKLKQQGNKQLEIEQELQETIKQMGTEIYLRSQELQKVNRQLRLANEALAELDRAKTVFFNNISHEFRTPLSLMLGPLEDILSNSSSLNVSERGQLEMVHRNSLRLLKLVNTLLDFARIEAGRMQAVYKQVDLASFTAELASVFRSAIERAGLSFQVDCPPLDKPIFIDSEMWEKIVLNLLSNALKFTFTGEIAVKLQAVGDGVELTVRDTGTGIPAPELPHIFERFHRIQGARSRTHEGSGIGLALVQELVKLHGGTVRVSSVVGEGTTFTVVIPTGSAHLRSQPMLAPDNLQPPVTKAADYVGEAWRWQPANGWDNVVGTEETYKYHLGVHSSSARILLVDDNADMRGYVKRLLSPAYEVEAVADGEAALIAVRERMPDLVLTDVMMPKLNGFELLQALRNDPDTKELPIILLSARAGEESRIEGLEAGADDYLIKPFSARELLARVRANLEMSHVRQEASKRIEVERAFLAAVLQQMPAAVMIAEAPSGRLLLSNEQVEKILRHPVLSTANFEGYDQYKGFYPDGQPYKLNDLPLVRAAIKGEVVVGEEIEYQCGDGVRRTMHANAAPICDRSGKIIAGVLTFADITERKQAEKALQHLNTNLENLVSERTAQLQQALDFEATLKRLVDKVKGSLDEHQIIQTAVQELALVLDIICCDAAMYDLEARTSTICYSYTVSSKIDTPTTPSSIGCVVQMDDLPEFYRQLLQGEYFQYCHLTCDPIRSQMAVLSCPIVDDRTVLGDLWLFNRKNYAFDELEIRLVQQVANQCAIAIRQARLYATATAQVEELEKLNALKDDFLSTVSHELRTPITNMKMAIQMLKMSPNPEKQSRYLEILQAECDRESQLINELLDLQRLEAGSYSLFLNDAIDLEKMVAELIEPFRVRTGERQQTLQLNLPPMPLIISDRASLERILAELLNNACKYTPRGGEIVLSICYQASEAATLFTVSNSVEIPENQLAHIFDKFYRVPNADPWKQGGTGLGLALIQKLIEQLQGTIEVENAQGWTTFSVLLPNQLPKCDRL
ncbi:ATP-binding protein [Aliterella atlantica]|uniref:ATP-binding protein n=1 Tax=Aliterella atlantica TaxID=1827278 RepID=UPI0006973C3E|nr:ATP-binding protein [Aliterella atlantica]